MVEIDRLIGGLFFLIVATLFFYIRSCLKEPPPKVAFELVVKPDGIPVSTPPLPD